VIPGINAEGGKCYPGALESHWHFLLNYRRCSLRQLILLSEMAAVWLSPAKGLMTEEPSRVLEVQETGWIHLVFSAFLLRAKGGVP